MVNCRHVFSENSREPSASRPRPSCTIIHFAMSSALELMPPAGFVLSLSKGLIARTAPSMGACGLATLPPAAAAECRTLLPRMPTFARIRVATKSSHDWPLTASITSPATRYSTLSYAYAERKLVAGRMKRSRRAISLRS